MTTITGYVLENFNASPSKAGLAASIFVIGVLTARLFTGKYLDIIGRKKLLYIGLVLSFVVSLLFFSIDNLTTLIFVRFVQGMVMGMAISVLQIGIMSIIPVNRQGEGISYYSLSLIVATAIGPFIGVFIMQMGNMRMIFIICTIICFICIILSFFTSIPKVELTSVQREDMKGFQLKNFIEKRALPIAALAGILAICYSGILSFLASYSKEIHLLSAASYFFIVYSFFVLLSRPFTGKILDSKGDNIVMFPAFFLFIAGLLVLSQAGNALTLLIAGALAGLGFGNLQSAAQAIAGQECSPSSGWLCHLHFLDLL